MPGTVPNSQAVVSTLRVYALSDVRFIVGRQTTDQEASVNYCRADLEEQIFHFARCDGPGVWIFHGPQSTEHNFAKLFTIAQSVQAAFGRLPMQQSDSDVPHRHKWISCSPAMLCQKHEHQSQNI